MHHGSPGAAVLPSNGNRGLAAGAGSAVAAAARKAIRSAATMKTLGFAEDIVLGDMEFKVWLILAS